MLMWIKRAIDRRRLPPGIRLGRNVHLGDSVKLDFTHGRHITIGDGATLAVGARVLCHDSSSFRRTGLTRVAPVTIGARAFVGSEAVVLPGVTVGEDAVVAAGAVVTRDVAPGAIVAGVPAREVGRVEDLDAERADVAAEQPPFPGHTYGRAELPPELAAALDRAVERWGGYFLRA